MAQPSKKTTKKWYSYVTRMGNHLLDEHQKIAQTQSVSQSLPLLLKLIVKEVWLGFLSIPVYVFFSADKVVHDAEEYPERKFAYRIRRVAVLGLLLSIFFALVAAWLFNTVTAQALPKNNREVVHTWSFANPTSPQTYTYDEGRVFFKGGVAHLATTAVGSSANTLARGCQAVIESREPVFVESDDKLIDFLVVSTVRGGAVGLQISTDKGQNWFWVERGSWVAANSSSRQFFSAPDDVAAHISSLPRPLEQKTALLFRAQLKSDCYAATELSSVSVRVRLSKRPQDIVERPDGMSVPVSTESSLPATLMSFTVSPSILAPYHVTLTSDPVRRSIVISGRALAHSDVAVFIDDPAVLIYRTVADEEGRWHVVHEQTYQSLSVGDHVVYAKTRDRVSPFVSESSEAIVFRIHDEPLPSFITAFDTRSTLVTLVILCGAMLLLSFRKKTTEAQSEE